MDSCNSITQRKYTPISFNSFRSPSTVSNTSHSDYFTQSAHSFIELKDPRHQLLQRWQTLSRQISQAALSGDAVIALNRNLDHVEDILSKQSLLDRGWKMSKINQELAISGMKDSAVGVDIGGEATPPASIAPENTRTSNSDVNDQVGDTALVERVMNAVTQLRRRQQEFKVRYTKE